jgi:hypothetical protein
MQSASQGFNTFDLAAPYLENNVAWAESGPVRRRALNNIDDTYPIVVVVLAHDPEDNIFFSIHPAVESRRVRLCVFQFEPP